MRVRVKTYAELQQYSPHKGEAFALEIPEGSTIRSLMERLEMPEHRVMFILRNGKKVKETERLKDGDEVFFYPIIGGGT
jgi:molybdopterin synthase sulfur carrier subunit